MSSTSPIPPEQTGTTTEPILENDVLWQEYIDLSGPIDEHVIKGWNKITDVFLLYVRRFFLNMSSYLFFL